MIPTDTPLTDSELNALFAEKVAGYRAYKEKRGDYSLCVACAANARDPWLTRRDPDPERYTPISCVEAARIGFFGSGLPRFIDDANAVLKWLEKYEYVDISYDRNFGEGAWSVAFSETRHSELFYAEAPTFSRAAVLALLKSKGVEFPVSGKGKEE